MKAFKLEFMLIDPNIKCLPKLRLGLAANTVFLAIEDFGVVGDYIGIMIGFFFCKKKMDGIYLVGNKIVGKIMMMSIEY